MARKMVVRLRDGSSPILSEVLAENEAELQELMKDNPDLLPVDEFGMTGPLMVVGRETSLPSGAVDLLAMSRGGELLIVEFKTGPQNSDFRHALAQLLDYGSDLWQMTYDEFEAAVARRYFEGSHCTNGAVRGRTSLEEAARATWPDLASEEVESFRNRLSEQLASGAFHYLLVAQQFTPSTERTVEYLNATSKAARFYAVELVRFGSGAVSAFEARTVLKPTVVKTSVGESLDLERILQAVEGDDYRAAMRELLEVCGGLGLIIFWGKAGVSIRLRTPDRTEPLSIGWLHPTGVVGWMGLRDVTLGFDTSSSSAVPSAAGPLEDYVRALSGIPGAAKAKPHGLRGYHLAPAVVVRERKRITEILASLVQAVSGGD